MKKAEVISVNGSQAVRLPDEFRFEGSKTISIRREGNAVILEPVEPETESSKAWPVGFFDKIRIEDPAFVRPPQGNMPPVAALDSK